MLNIVSLFPNPASSGAQFNIKNLLYAYGQQVKVQFYNLAGVLVSSYDLTDETTQATLTSGQYKAIITLNGTQINGDIDFLITGLVGE